MDFCSVRQAVINKAMKIASDSGVFEKLSDTSFRTDYAGIVQQLNESFGGNIIGTQEATIKSGVDNLFSQHPELQKIGSREEYFQYLDSIFPNSKVKDMVYHGTSEDGKSDIHKQGFNNNHKGTVVMGNTKGFYFTPRIETAQNYGVDIVSAMLNITNLYSSRENTQNLNDALIKSYKEKGIDGVAVSTDKESLKKDIELLRANPNSGLSEDAKNRILKSWEKELSNNTAVEIAVFDSDQIHILGDGQDMEKFRNWKNSSSKIYVIDPAENVVNAYIFEANKDRLDDFDKYKDDVRPMWRAAMDVSRAKGIMFEIAQQLKSSESEAATARRAFGDRISDAALALFPEVLPGDTMDKFEFTTPPLENLKDDDTFYNLSRTGEFSYLQQSILTFLSTKKRMIHKFDPKNHSRYYFTNPFEDDYYRVKTVAEYERWMAYHGFDQDMFDHGVSENGIPYIEINKSYREKGKDKIEANKASDRQKAIIDFLSKRFQLGDKIEVITKEDFRKRFPDVYKENMTSAIHKGRVYIFPRATNDVAAEELLHPFIEGLYQSNSGLFQKLLSEAKKNFPLLTEEIKALYVGENNRDIEKEIVTQALSRTYTKLTDSQQPTSLSQALRDLSIWIRGVFNDILKYFGLDSTKIIYSDSFDINTTLDDLARIINTDDTVFPVAFPTNPVYNLENLSFSENVTNIIKDKGMEDKVEVILGGFTSAIRDIRNKLDKSINEKERKELTALISYLDEAQGKEDMIKVQLNTIIKAIRIFDIIDQEIITFDKDDNQSDINKLKFFMSTYKTIRTLDGFADMMIELRNELDKSVGKPTEYIPVLKNGKSVLVNGKPKMINKYKDLNDFYKLLNKAISIRDTINSRVVGTIKGPLKNVYTQYSFPVVKEAMDKKNKQIAELEAKIKSTKGDTTALDKEMSVLVREKNDLLRIAPTKENWDKIFAGDWLDANKLSMTFESGIVNGHPLVQNFLSFIQDAYLEAQQDTLQNRNELQRALDTYLEKTNQWKRNPASFNDKLLDEVDIPMSVVEDEDGNVVGFNYVTQMAIIGDIDNKYITTYLEHQVKTRHLYDKIIEYKTSKNSVKEAEMMKKNKEAHEEFTKFKKESVQGRYTEIIYDWKAILETMVKKDDGTEVSLRSLTNDLYDKLDDVEHQLNQPISTDEAVNLNGTKKILNMQIKALKSSHDDEGNVKTGEAKRIADLLTDYNKKKYEYGEYVITPQGEERYKLDIQVLEDQKARGEISEDEYIRRLSRITKITPTKEYFRILKDTGDLIDKSLQEILDIVQYEPVLNEGFDRTLKDKTKEAYTRIQDMVRRFRDENNIIDGIFLEEQAPELVNVIREIQQAVEDLKYQSMSLKDVSKEEQQKIKNYENARQYQNPEYIALKEKQRIVKAFYTQNETLISGYQALLEGLSNFTETINTDYYYDQRNKEVVKLQNTEEIMAPARDEVNAAMDNQVLFAGNSQYIKHDGKWYGINYENGVRSEDPLFNNDDATDTGMDVVVERLAKANAEVLISTSEWYKKNHFLKYKFDKASQSYIPTLTPIYIWQQTSPLSSAYLEKTPAFEYLKYEIFDRPEFRNNNYSTIYKGVPAPKAGKYIKDNLSKLSPDELNYRSELTRIYAGSQEHLEEIDKMGLVLPALVKTEGENIVNITNNIFDTKFKELWTTIFTGETDTDTAMVFGGSQDNPHIVPKRFLKPMDKSKQSRNIVAMIAMFDLYANLNKQLNERIPIFEATRIFADSVTTLKKKTPSVKSKIKQALGLEVNKEQPTTLSKSIGGFMDMFVYGQTRKPYTIDWGPFGRVDMSKIVSSISSVVGKTIFVGNIVSAINNSVSTRLQAIIQSSIKKGIYSFTDLYRAQILAPKYTVDFARDWTKMGNKSLIGQVLDYFQFSPDSLNKEITNKSEFFITKQKMEFLTSAKAISEFEALFIQFLAVANRFIVMKNGKEIQLSSIEEIFELKDGNLKLKDGVVFPKEKQTRFINIFRKMSREIGGAYRTTEQTQLETEWWGQAAMFMKRYFVPLVTVRYAGERWSGEYADRTEGYYRSTFRNIYDLFKTYKGNMTAQWENLTSDDKANYYRVLNELLMIVALNAAFMLMGGNDDRKVLRKNSVPYNFALVVLMRARSEIETFNAMFGWNEVIRMMRTPFMATQAVVNVYNTLGALYNTMIGSDKAFYQQNTGIHKKGDMKLVANLFKTFGYTGNTFHLPEYISNYTNQQNVAR